MSKLIGMVMLIAAIALAGCAASYGYHAPIIDHSVSASGNPVAERSPVVESGIPDHGNDVEQTSTQPEKDWRPQVYKVQKGDTLYSIAFNFGFDYHELAELNGIPDPTVIHIGQEIRLFPAAGAAAVSRATENRPDIKSQPVVSKLPYSEQAVAQIEKMQAGSTKIAAKTEVGTKPVVAVKPVVEVKPVVDVKPGKPEVIVTAGTAEAVKWEMPTSGKVVGNFSENDNRKGIDIAGKQGQPVYASAPGKVVYSGSGLRGYGKLIIIKHNSTYLSAYAHNDKLLVKEGQMVAKGQMIAGMGSTDANRVVLHFEIRKLGKPVDPAKYLTLPKS